jgi:hypothetical protein
VHDVGAADGYAFGDLEVFCEEDDTVVITLIILNLYHFVFYPIQINRLDFVDDVFILDSQFDLFGLVGSSSTHSILQFHLVVDLTGRIQELHTVVALDLQSTS